ncbi:EKC/KEOPS complex subunit LAGE3-like [Sturnira hondurensis]|uniref:EKC/KEOPS complex subunit LAGE3-like n=1 Tax=Sturnira hondurensis TaxID=192404 RepID=UPI0018798CD0|nr:EKC/KEOPS complex subunit LAGE3-like [Sturnira hondurensis]XP_036908449.1 EKC/KEOPS complex subunit LAGE3-like [Sturnira hondurensis]XP_036908450.1 EKC/KEOPS complex subunit LAGE3-like [Sturnira hondurensis]
MQAADAGPTGGSGQDSWDGLGSPGGVGAAAAAAGRAAALLTRRPGNRPHTFTLSVPFPSPLEADIACGSLAPDAEPHRDAVRKELTVSGSVLAVCWRAEDARLLRISVVSFLDQLSLVMQTMHRFGPPLSR